MVMRTAAPLALSTHGWSEIAISRWVPLSNAACTTRRLKTIVRLLVWWGGNVDILPALKRRGFLLR